MGVGALILRRYRHLCTLILEDENFMKISCRACLLSYCFFDDKKIAFKSSLDLYLHPSINKFKFEEKIRTKAIVDMSRSAGRRAFLFFWERLGGG